MDWIAFEILEFFEVVVIPVSRNYQRITTYGFDPWGKSSHGYDKDTVYDLRLTTYGLRISTVSPEIIRIEDI